MVGSYDAAFRKSEKLKKSVTLAIPESSDTEGENRPKSRTQPVQIYDKLPPPQSSVYEGKK